MIEFLLKDKAGKQIIDSLPIAVYATDLEGRLKYYNSAAEKLSGRKPKLGTDRWCVGWKLYYPDGTPMPHDESPMALYLRKDKFCRGDEVMVERPDGEHIWFKAYPSLLHDEAGEIIGGINVLADITDQKEAEKELRWNEQALRKSEEKYRTLFEKMDEGFCIIKMEFDDNDEPVDFHYLETNPAYHIHSGLEDIAGKSATEVMPNLKGDMLRRNGNVALTGEPFHSVIYVDEIDRWLDLSAFRIGSPEERKVAVLFTDITARKENGLTNAYLGAIVDGSDDAVISKDLDSIITSWNNGAERMFGYTASEAIGQAVTILIPDDRINEEEEILNQIKQGKKVDHFETIRKCKDGTLLDVSLTISPVKNTEGVIVGASKIARNITERKKAQEERERLLQQVETERERLADIFEYAPSIMGVLQGPDHIIERANNFFMQFVGNREIIGKPVRTAIPEAAEQGFIDLLNKVYKTGQSFRGTDMEIALHRKEGSKQIIEKRYLDYVFQPIYKAREIISGVFVQGVDITQRKRAKEKLKAMNETLEERVDERTQALLSYQEKLRSLASQLSRAEEVQRQQLATELHDNLGQLLALGKIKVNEIHNDQLSKRSAAAIEELKKIMDDALTYTRELTSDLKPPRSINEDIRASINWVAEKVEQHGLLVTIEDDGEPKSLDEDVRATVLQSVRELLINVVKHTSEKKATVRLERSKNQLHITVKDEGIGFDRGAREFKSGKEGGYGLFNILERVDLLGGEVDIATKQGQGTEVTLSVPLLKEDKIPETVEQSDVIEQNYKTKPAQIGQAQRTKVLLVDDHKMFRNGLRKIIEEQDDLSVVGEAGDGEKAVALSRETSPDVILMDVSMPKMDGIEATVKITAEMPNVRIIGVSLHDSQEVMQDMQNAGASAYLTKTEAFESLIKIIRAEARTKNE